MSPGYDRSKKKKKKNLQTVAPLPDGRLCAPNDHTDAEKNAPPADRCCTRVQSTEKLRTPGQLLLPIASQGCPIMHQHHSLT
jgi:hypothetical protein